MAEKLYTPWQVEQKLAAIKALRDQIARLTDDDEVIRDTLDGEIDEKDFDRVINSLLFKRNEELAVAKARKEYAADLTSAAKASEARADKIDDMLNTALKAAMRDDWKGVMGSLGYSLAPLKLEIVNEARIPIDYSKPAWDIAKIKEDALAIEAQRSAIVNDPHLTAKQREEKLALVPQIPGVQLTRGEPVFNVRKPRGKKGVAE